MMYKFWGAALVVLSCGGFGFTMAAAHRREVRMLNAFIAAISFMRCELQYRCTPLPELCKKTSVMMQNMIGRFFHILSVELESQICPDTRSCALNALSKIKELPRSVQDCIISMADTLGCFDLEGQLQGLSQAEQQAGRILEKLTYEQDKRLRSYQTLGLCAGAALAIILV